MGNNKQLVANNSDEIVPTQILASTFVISIAMGLVVVSGVIFKPYEAKEVVEELHEKILYEREMREIRRLSYDEELGHSMSPASYSAPTVVSDSSGSGYKSGSSYSVKPSASSGAKKTERAKKFERDVRSDDYWASLHASVRGHDIAPSSEPVVIPPVIVGSAD